MTFQTFPACWKKNVRDNRILNYRSWIIDCCNLQYCKAMKYNFQCNLAIVEGMNVEYIIKSSRTCSNWGRALRIKYAILQSTLHRTHCLAQYTLPATLYLYSYWSHYQVHYVVLVQVCRIAYYTGVSKQFESSWLFKML